MIEQTAHMTINDFITAYDRAPFELIRGEIRHMTPPVAGHSSIAHTMYHLLYNTRAGRVFIETAFVLNYDTNWVRGSRVPDVMFFSKERFEAYTSDSEDWQDKPFVLVPDLVVEVVSANDSYTDISEKVDLYLLDGVKIVWVIDPKRKTVTIYADKHFDTLSGDDTLTAGDVIPKFEVAVKTVFA